MGSATIAGTEVRTLMWGLIDRGVSQAAVEAACGRTYESLAGPDSRAPLDVALRLFDQLDVLAGTPGVALELGRTCKSEYRSVVFHVASNCRTTRESFEVAARFARLNSDLDTLQIIDEPRGRTAIELRPRFPHLARVAWAEFGLARLITTLRGIFQHDLRVLDVSFSHEEPGHRKAYEAVFTPSVRFGAPRSAVVVPTHLLDREIPGAQPYLRDVLLSRAESLLEALAAEATLRGRVERALLDSLARAEAQVEEVAKRLAMSRQTLYRRLKEEGTSFKEVQDELRNSLAQTYLRRDDLSVSEVAFMLGFSETSSFHRACKRWFGMGPAAWREAESPAAGSESV